MIKITNLKDRLVNLGTIKGRMLVLNPNQTIEVSQEVVDNFERIITGYVEGGFIAVQKESKKPKVTNEFKAEEPVVQPTTEKTTTKRVKKGKVNKE